METHFATDSGIFVFDPRPLDTTLTVERGGSSVRKKEDPLIYRK
jgi:hypothetical protein